MSKRTDSQKLDAILEQLGSIETQLSSHSERLSRIEADVRTIKIILNIDQQMENLQTVLASRHQSTQSD